MKVYVVLKKLKYQGTFSTKEKAEKAIARLGWQDCHIYQIVVDHYDEF